MTGGPHCRIYNFKKGGLNERGFFLFSPFSSECCISVEVLRLLRRQCYAAVYTLYMAPVFKIKGSNPQCEFVEEAAIKPRRTEVSSCCGTYGGFAALFLASMLLLKVYACNSAQKSSLFYCWLLFLYPKLRGENIPENAKKIAPVWVTFNSRHLPNTNCARPVDCCCVGGSAHRASRMTHRSRALVQI